MLQRRMVLTMLLLLAAGCASSAHVHRVRGDTPPPERSSGGDLRGTVMHGEATWYSDSLAGHHTASGIPYEPHALTAAHRTLPFGTVVRVTRRATGESVDVQINDRGPFGRSSRIIDLSHAAAARLGMLGAGVTEVDVEVIGWRSTRDRLVER